MSNCFVTIISKPISYCIINWEEKEGEGRGRKGRGGRREEGSGGSRRGGEGRKEEK